MISINGTLIVQIIAFLWAWWFLDKYLLKPVVTVIQQEDVVQQEIETALEIQKKQLATKNRYKQDRWFHFKMLFSRGTPKVISSPDVSCNQAQKALPGHHAFTEQEKNELQEATATLVAKRIAHDL